MTDERFSVWAPERERVRLAGSYSGLASENDFHF